MSALFVVVEGLDGTGKTTAARAVAQHLGWAYRRTPPPAFSDLRGVVDRSDSLLAEAHFYLAGVFVAAREIQDLLDAGQSVVCDRYLHTTVATYTQPMTALYPDFERLLDRAGSHIPLPDLTVALHAVPDVRRQRMVQRGSTSNSDRDSLTPDSIAEADAFYAAINAVRLDTSDMGPEEVRDAIVELVTRHRQVGSE